MFSGAEIFSTKLFRPCLLCSFFAVMVQLLRINISLIFCLNRNGAKSVNKFPKKSVFSVCKIPIYRQM